MLLIRNQVRICMGNADRIVAGFQKQDSGIEAATTLISRDLCN
jgi:hypothetical protein